MDSKRVDEFKQWYDDLDIPAAINYKLGRLYVPMIKTSILINGLLPASMAETLRVAQRHIVAQVVREGQLATQVKLNQSKFELENFDGKQGWQVVTIQPHGYVVKIK